MNIEELKKILRDMGVVGAGGAGFPTYEKLYEGAKYLIMNAAECEPLFKVDQELMVNHTYKVLKGFSIIMETLNIPKGIIALKESYSESIKAIENSVKLFKNIEIKKLKDSYPLGDELVLIYESIGEVIPQGKIPRAKGVIVINVETSLNVYNAVEEKIPVTETYITVSGNISNPKSFKVPIGIKVKDILDYMNIILGERDRILIGGPMTGRVGNLETIVTKTTKGILIIPENKRVFTAQEENYLHLKKQAFSACSQCQMCTDLCPRYQLGYDIQPHKIMNTVVYGDDYLNLLGVFSCCECNLCTLYSCHQALNPMMIIRNFKDKLKKAGLKPLVKEVQPRKEREYRKVPGKGLKQRLGLVGMDKKAPLSIFKTDCEYFQIPLQQHIGSKSIPIVKLKEKVKIGEVLAKAGEGLGVSIHSPVNGDVLEIAEKYILIKREGSL